MALAEYWMATCPPPPPPLNLSDMWCKMTCVAKYWQIYFIDNIEKYCLEEHFYSLIFLKNYFPTTIKFWLCFIMFQRILVRDLSSIPEGERALGDLLIMIAPFCPMFAMALWDKFRVLPGHVYDGFNWVCVHGISCRLTIIFQGTHLCSLPAIGWDVLLEGSFV